MAEAGSPTPVTPATLFQAASISKSVAALAAMRLGEQGRLALDEDVNSRLVSWKLPENEFTRTEKVTLRRLLSHSAGLTVHGFPGYAVTAPVPTTVQVLDGATPANTAPVRVDLVPGTRFRYSGGGTTVVQLALVDQLGTPFPKIMDDTVLSPLDLHGRRVHRVRRVVPDLAESGLAPAGRGRRRERAEEDRSPAVRAATVHRVRCVRVRLPGQGPARDLRHERGRDALAIEPVSVAGEPAGDGSYRQRRDDAPVPVSRD